MESPLRIDAFLAARERGTASFACTASRGFNARMFQGRRRFRGRTTHFLASRRRCGKPFVDRHPLWQRPGGLMFRVVAGRKGGVVTSGSPGMS